MKKIKLNKDVVDENNKVILKKGTILSVEEENSSHKGILEFDLTDYDQKMEFENAIKGTSNKIKIDSLYNDVFRSGIRYGNFNNKELSQKETELFEAIWNKVSNHFNEE